MKSTQAVVTLLVTNQGFYAINCTEGKKRGMTERYPDNTDDRLKQEELYTSGWFSKAKEKDEEGLTVFYHLYKRELFAYIVRRLGRYEDAEDLLVKVFEKIFLNFHKIFSMSALRPYIYRITRNAVFEYYRKKKTVKSRETVNLDDVVLESHYGNPGDILEKKEEIIRLREAMLMLPATEYEVLKLFYDTRKSTKEIASAAGKSVRSIESILYRGRKRLGTILEQPESSVYPGIVNAGKDSAVDGTDSAVDGKDSAVDGKDSAVEWKESV
ncbi:MAG: sigma-70 family RNA polymerase sigma factor [Spirochaetales bacterium]|nr:sigma-70 family RNA polymerase sigma factor [Spirochaetales bacterium]